MLDIPIVENVALVITLGTNVDLATIQIEYVSSTTRLLIEVFVSVTSVSIE